MQPSATLSYTNRTGTGLGLSPGLRSERPATNSQIHGMACGILHPSTILLALYRTCTRNRPTTDTYILCGWANINVNRRSKSYFGFTGGTRWRSWLRHCATNRKVAGSIPYGVIKFFIGIILPAALWHWG